MKKFTLLLLAAALLPMTINAQVKMRGEAPVKVAKVTKTVAGPTAIKNTLAPKLRAVGPKADVPEGYASVTLTAGDIWQDGSGYQMLLDEDAIAYGSIFQETGPLTTSGDATEATYAEFEYKIPENADGACATQNIVINNSVTILIPAGVYDWCITNPTPGDRIWIASANGSIGGRADDFQFASGAAYEFVVSFGGQYDQVDLVIDDPTAPAIPTELTVDAVSVDGTTANIAWTPGENNTAWNLRWRPYVDPALVGANWFMNIDNYQDVAGQFMILDADGDGENWSLWYADDAQYDVCFGSESYSSSTYSALTPDNWLITPEVGMGGTLKFKTWNYSSSYPDQIAVYYAPANWETTDDFIQISDVIVPGTEPEEYEFDLSEYEGMGVIAFRHFGVSDMWRIMVGYIEVVLPDAPEIPDWTFVENVENPYTLEGLMPETEYEVQVQGVGADARTTDWTESVRFITEAGAQPETGYFLVGTFNGWDQTAEGGRIAFDDENRAEVHLNAGEEFKVITPAEDGGWIWLGGVDDNQVGYFLITPELLSYNLTLTDGANFRVQEGGTYHINLIWDRTEGLPSHIVVTLAEPDAITTITSDKADNRIFDLQGRELKSVPETGIYIQNGKKYVK